VWGSGTLLSTILGGSGQDYATAVASDVQGNVYVVGLTYSPDFPVSPEAAQTHLGGTSDAFVAKLGPDGKRIWATYLGGLLDDWATGVSLDSAGNVWVTGITRSANFPLVNPIQSSLDGGASDNYDAFVAKLDPNGTTLLYSTFLGGPADDAGAGIVVDPVGNAYVAVSSDSSTGFPGILHMANQPGIFITKLTPPGKLSYSYFHPYGVAGGIALDMAGDIYVAASVSSINPSSAGKMFGPPGSGYAIVFKVAGDGSRKIYETALGGSVKASAAGIAVDSSGHAYVAGSTSSVDFPLAHPLQTSPGARPLWKSADAGNTWTPIDDLPFALPGALAVDPTATRTVYAASGDMGVLKSLDGGATWAKTNSRIAGARVQALTIDPAHPQTLYAATPDSVYKSTDGAAQWSQIDSPPFAVSQIGVDPQNPNILYEIGANIRKSSDGGTTWYAVTFPGTVSSFALDPQVSGRLFAISNPVFGGFFSGNNQPAYLYRSVDGGSTWVQIEPAPAQYPGLIVDASTNPSTVYDGLTARSVDGGVTWSSIPLPPFGISYVDAMAVDPTGALYVSVAGKGIFVSHDGAQTWTAAGNPASPANSGRFGPGVTAIVPAGPSGTLYAIINQVATSGFVSKLGPDGSALEFSTYLRGHASTEAFPEFLAEPDAMFLQNWISGIALDLAGNIVVAGGTRSNDLPTANPAQAANAGLADAFASILAADGSELIYSTYFGGSQDDGALAASVDSMGNILLAGQTWSGDFPIPGGVQPPTGFGEAFVVKLATGVPAITAVVNGASYQPGIAAGSWVTIRGVNLANTNPGRTWTSADIVNGKLPASIDGVSVTINGQPAFVEYVSPTQINVQAPSDDAVGAVNVIVNNNGVVSSPASAQLQEFAPAFFLEGATGFAAASRLPDYALVGDPSVVPGAVGAKPGDFVILWGTGFGATSPPVAAGTTVEGAPSLTDAPTVTVGGVGAQVISAVLSTGNAGLYQVTIQLPSNVPSGAVPVQASVGQVKTPGGVYIFVVAH
jgi:uncharacterized protein (TIGR03437 family)